MECIKQNIYTKSVYILQHIIGNELLHRTVLIIIMSINHGFNELYCPPHDIAVAICYSVFIPIVLINTMIANKLFIGFCIKSCSAFPHKYL